MVISAKLPKVNRVGEPVNQEGCLKQLDISVSVRAVKRPTLNDRTVHETETLR